jgi:hypothetical protein
MKKIFFSHIPKNCGSSIEEYFLDLLGSQSVFGVGLEGSAVRNNFYEYRFNILRDYNLIAGHLPISRIEDSLDYFDLILAVIRDPFARFISMANYVTSTQVEYSGITNLADFGNRFYFSNVSTRNEQCGYIGKINTFSSANEMIINRKNLVVIRHESVDRDFEIICKKLELGSGLLSKLNVTNYKKALFQIEDLYSDTELLQKFCSWFADDIVLYLKYRFGDLVCNL